jgi:EF-P beta-lysylation protein EpmB
MILRTSVLRQTPAAWQAELAQAVTDPAALLELLDLDPVWLPAARAAAQLFPLRVPCGYVARMRRGDPHDPLLRQVLPLDEELREVPGFGDDPVGDRQAMAAPGVLHKYEGRVLLTATGACAIHCRYCFRRHYPYAQANAAADGWRLALDHIAADATIEEVILSGGDPLTLGDRRLGEFAAAAAAIPHLKRLRVHTRLPIVLPERVDASLLAWLRATRLKPIVVVHTNHANEIDVPVRAALAALADAGVVLLNQSVLLRGVNDSADALVALSTTLFDAGVIPYYLHLLDRVRGAAHFEIDEAQAGAVMAAVRARLPGYLVPRLVREEAGAPAKTVR